MVKDAKLSELRRQLGAKGGNPHLLNQKVIYKAMVHERRDIDPHPPPQKTISLKPNKPEVNCRGGIHATTAILKSPMYASALPLPKTPANVLRSNRAWLARKPAENPRYQTERKARYRKAHPVKLTANQRERSRAPSRRFYKRHRKEIAAAYARRTRQSASEQPTTTTTTTTTKELTHG